MGYAYSAKVTDTPDPTAPDDWPSSWTFPPTLTCTVTTGVITSVTAAWPPAWPPAASSGVTLSTTMADSVAVGGSAAIVARVLDGGIDTDELNTHVIGIAAAMDGATLQLKSSPSDSFTDSVQATIGNYTGSRYGISQSLYFDIDSGDIGKTITVTATIITVSPLVSGSDTCLVTGELLVVAGVMGTNRVETSSDGITWTGRTEAESNTWQDCCWANALGLYCAISSDGTHRVMTSPDGITWTARTAAAANQWVALCWSPDLNLFCAVAQLIDEFMTSPDGITWTTRTAPTSTNGRWYAVTWSHELSLFCAVGNQCIATSPDGITWTARNSPQAVSWGGLCWSPDLAIFCATQNSGAGKYTMTSSDGVTWTSGNQASSMTQIHSVCWSPTNALFVAVGNGPSLLTSANGSSWTVLSATANAAWGSVIWSQALGLFVANATSNIMTSPDGVNWTARTPAHNGARGAIAHKS